MDTTESILIDYDAKHKVYNNFEFQLRKLLDSLLILGNSKFHQVTNRVKSRDSLKMKLSKKINKYNSLLDVTDIVGFRIITLLESQVDPISELIAAEFEIDTENSIDKRQLEVNEFGYKSLHIIASLKSNRTDLTEFKPFAGLKFEIQLRTILQHAWAEIEHDLGYKSKSAIPNEYKRSFNRLAALLENGDIEFDRLKSALADYEKIAEKDVIDNLDWILINQPTLFTFIKSNATFNDINNFVIKRIRATPVEVQDLTFYIERFPLIGISYIDELSKKLERYKDQFKEFVDSWVGDKIHPSVPSTIGLYYFQHFLAGLTQNEKIVSRYLNFGENKISGGNSFAKDLISLTKKFVN